MNSSVAKLAEAHAMQPNPPLPTLTIGSPSIANVRSVVASVCGSIVSTDARRKWLSASPHPERICRLVDFSRHYGVEFAVAALHQSISK